MSPDLDAIRAALAAADQPHTDDCDELDGPPWCTCGCDRDVEHLRDRAPDWLAALLVAVDDVRDLASELSEAAGSVSAEYVADRIERAVGAS